MDISHIPKKGEVARIAAQFPTLRRLGFAVQSFPRYVNRRPKLHRVDAVLLTFVVRGNGFHVMENTRYVERGGTLAITHSDEQHTLLTDRHGMEVINIYLLPERCPWPRLPKDLRSALSLLIPSHRILKHRLNRLVRLELEEPAAIASLLRLIEKEQQSLHEPGAEMAMWDLWRVFLTHCGRAMLSNDVLPSIQIHGALELRLEELRHTLDLDYSQEWSLGRMAQMVGVSEAHLSRSFSLHAGKSPIRYLLDRRLAAAMAELRGTDEKVTTIALEAGFQDISYFNRSFRRAFGLSPKECRLGAIGS